MIDTLFLEDCDLLENVFITKQINESEFEEFNTLISEQEMMISLYENQQFLVEQDTEVFMHLRYSNTEVLSEGVLEGIGKAIMAVLQRIKELISKFIGFIFGKRKSEKSVEKQIKNVEDNEEKIVETIIQTEKKLEEVKDKFESSVNNAQKAGVDEDKILKTKEDIDEYFSAKPKEEYKVIEIDQDTMRKLNITKKWNELADMISILEQCVNSLRRKDPNGIPKSLQDTYEKYKKSLAIQKDDLSTMLIVPAQKCDRDTYYKKYYKDAKAFYRNYTDESVKNLEFLQKLNTRIDKLTKAIKNIEMYNENKSEAWTNTIKNVSRMVSDISSDCNSRIQTLIEIEQGYQAYKYNMKLTSNQYLKCNRMANKVSKEFDKNMSDKNKRLVFGDNGPYFADIDVDGIKKHNPGLVEDILSILQS